MLVWQDKDEDGLQCQNEHDGGDGQQLQAARAAFRRLGDEFNRLKFDEGMADFDAVSGAELDFLVDDLVVDCRRVERSEVAEPHAVFSLFKYGVAAGDGSVVCEVDLTGGIPADEDVTLLDGDSAPFEAAAMKNKPIHLQSMRCDVTR